MACAGPHTHTLGACSSVSHTPSPGLDPGGQPVGTERHNTQRDGGPPTCGDRSGRSGSGSGGRADTRQSPQRCPPRPSSPHPRAMVQNHCRQIKAVTSQLLPNLQNEEERERKAAILVLLEVAARAGRRDTVPSSSHLSARSGPFVGGGPPDGLLTPLLPAPVSSAVASPGLGPPLSSPCQRPRLSSHSARPALPQPLQSWAQVPPGAVKSREHRLEQDRP